MLKRNQFAGRKNYANGYLPKIAYHLAANNAEKVTYFMNRQVELYGPINAEDMAFVTKEANKIQRVWAMEMQEFRSHLG